MKSYLDIVRHILTKGTRKQNRTGVDTLSVSGVMFEHDMAQGFPLLTTKKMPFKTIRVELEFFIKGFTDKKWLQDRRCTIWDEWANPKKAPYGHDEESKHRMREERDLGPVYGFQWRHFDAPYVSYDTDYTGQGIDQLAKVIETIKKNPTDRRMIVMAWNPKALPEQALPPCHYGFQVLVTDGKLDLLWNQRSVDTMLGLPFNIASYALLLHLLAKETRLGEGKLIGFLADTHIYVNQIEGANLQLAREPKPLPRIVTEPFTSIFDWSGEHTRLEGYESHDRIEFPIAV
jgi:thymidylate synthase